jgi:hypothetical protein
MLSLAIVRGFFILERMIEQPKVGVLIRDRTGTLELRCPLQDHMKATTGSNPVIPHFSQNR